MSKTLDDGAAELEAALMQRFSALPLLLANDQKLLVRGHKLDVTCVVGLIVNPVHLTFVDGRIADLTIGPLLMRSWQFAFRATAMAWSEHWKPTPRAGWHDLLALTKRGEAVLEGNLLPFMTHLQFFKDVLALPRTSSGAL